MAPVLWPGRNAGAVNYISAPPDAAFAGLARRKLVILGSTGSIGRNALKVASQAQGRLEIMALAGGDNVELLLQQARRWRPDWLAVRTRELAQQLEMGLEPGYRPNVLYGQAGYAELAALAPADLILSAQSGSAGLAATLAAARAGKVIALANKESLVLAGGLIRRICVSSGAVILPVDSEHYAIFQCAAGRGDTVSSITLTASGGPFLHAAAAEMANATPAAALKHPAWKMGPKISIDSASLMNKGLEFIEAMHLYGLPPDRISILVHPQAIIHSLVTLGDNSQIAQLGVADMRLAIGGCLLWPQAREPFIAPLDLTQAGNLTFLAPALDRFPCLALALAAARHAPDFAWHKAGLNPACIALNAANEAAVELFLRGGCRFGDLACMIRTALAPWLDGSGPELEIDALPGQELELIERIAAKARAVAAASQLAQS